MVAGADLVVDAEADLHHALAAFELLRVLGADAALARQHALAVGDDDFEAALRRAHRLLQRVHHRGHAISADGAQPGDAERAQRVLDADAGRRAAAIAFAR